jgi:hypothetical protein
MAQRPNKLDALSHADAAFVIDTTGSMGSFLSAAKQTLLDTLAELSTREGVELSVGLVEFRDHPPQERSFVTRATDFTQDRDALQAVINGLSANGGGDAPEAVYQGMWDALALEWRPHSARYLLLVGDAPPHAYPKWHEARTGEALRGWGDGWPDACPSGHDPESVSARAEELNVRVFSVCMGEHPLTVASFKTLSQLTGGASYTSAQGGQAVIEKLAALLKDELADVAFDREVLALLDEGIAQETIAERLDVGEVNVAASVARLGKRGLLDQSCR